MHESTHATLDKVHEYWRQWTVNIRSPLIFRVKIVFIVSIWTKSDESFFHGEKALSKWNHQIIIIDRQATEKTLCAHQTLFCRISFRKLLIPAHGACMLLVTATSSSTQIGFWWAHVQKKRRYRFQPTQKVEKCSATSTKNATSEDTFH